MIDLLRRIGLSELEARCYMALHEDPGLTGYEVAKRVSVSRTNVYAALRSLMDKGACSVVEEKTPRYDAVPIDHVIRYFRAEFEQTAGHLVNGLKSPPRDAASFYTWKGMDSIAMAMKRMAAAADATVIVDMWSEDVQWIEDALVHAQSRGLTVILVVMGEIQSPIKNVINHKRGQDEWSGFRTRKFSMLCDSRFALLGNLGDSRKPSALETESPAVIEVLRNAFFHDLLLQTIETDFATELAEKYGSHYEDLVDRFIRKKGWKI